MKGLCKKTLILVAAQMCKPIGQHLLAGQCLPHSRPGLKTGDLCACRLTQSTSACHRHEVYHYIMKCKEFSSKHGLPRSDARRKI